MKSTTRIVLICAGAAMVAGVVLMLAGYFSGAKLTIAREKSGVRAVDLEKRQVVNAGLRPFDGIDCTLECDVSVVSGSGYSIKINSSRYDGLITYAVQNGRLVISEKVNHHDGQMNINFGVKIPESIVTVTVPKGKRFGTVKLKSDYGDITTNGVHADTLTADTDDGDCDIQSGQSNSLSITDSNGDVNVFGVTADALAIKEENGDLLLKTISAGNLTLTNGNGDISLEEVRAQKCITVTNDCGQSVLQSVGADTLSVTNSEGDIRLTQCKGAVCTLKAQDGGIAAEQLESAGLTVGEQNGDITLAGSFTGTARITSDCGAIQLTSALARKLYNMDFSLGYGDLTVDGQDEKNSLTENNRAQNTLTIQSESGDVAVNFGK